MDQTGLVCESGRSHSALRHVNALTESVEEAAEAPQAGSGADEGQNGHPKPHPQYHVLMNHLNPQARPFRESRPIAVACSSAVKFARPRPYIGLASPCPKCPPTS